MSAIVFGDLFKSVGDYFSKPYVSNAFVLEGKLTAAECDNLKITPLIEKTAQNTVLSGIEFEQTTPISTPHSLVANAKVNIKSSGQTKGEVKLSKFGIDGLGVNVGGDLSLQDSAKDQFNAAIEFKKPSGTIIAKFLKAQSKPNPTTELSFTLLYNKRFLIGALGRLDGPSLQSYEGGVSVLSPDSTVSALITSSNSIKIGGLYNTATRCQVGAEVELSDQGVPSFKVGYQRTLKGTKFNAKVDDKGNLSLAASHRLGNVTSIVSTEFDTKKFAVARTGVKLTWEE